jgi:hypothetical protein
MLRGLATERSGPSRSQPSYGSKGTPAVKKSARPKEKPLSQKERLGCKNFDGPVLSSWFLDSPLFRGASRPCKLASQHIYRLVAHFRVSELLLTLSIAFS